MQYSVVDPDYQKYEADHTKTNVFRIKRGFFTNLDVSIYFNCI